VASMPHWIQNRYRGWYTFRFPLTVGRRLVQGVDDPPQAVDGVVLIGRTLFFLVRLGGEVLGAVAGKLRDRGLRCAKDIRLARLSA